MRDFLVTIIVFGSLPIILFRPQVGVIVWCWLSYMNPQTLAYGFATHIPFAAIVAVVLLIGMFVSREPKRIPWSSLVALWFLWVGWQCLTTWFALYPTVAEVALKKTLKIQLVTLCILMVMWSRPRIEATVWIIVLSLGYYGVRGGIGTLLTGGQYRVWGATGGFFEGNNEIGLALTMVLPLMRYLQLSANKRWLRLGVIGAMGLSVVAVVGTYSRGAFLAASAMGLVLAMKSRHRFRVLLAGALLVPLVLGLMPERWFDRMGTIKTYEQDDSAMARINSWTFAVNFANDHPVFGGGYGTFQPKEFADYAPNPTEVFDAHSIYFEVLAEHGYVGLLLFVVLAAAAWRTASRTAALARERADMEWAFDLSRMLQVSIVGFAVGGTFLGLAYFDLYYNLIALIVLVHAVVRKTIAEQPATRSLELQKPRFVGHPTRRDSSVSPARS